MTPSARRGDGECSAPRQSGARQQRRREARTGNENDVICCSIKDVNVLVRFALISSSFVDVIFVFISRHLIHSLAVIERWPRVGFTCDVYYFAAIVGLVS